MDDVSHAFTTIQRQQSAGSIGHALHQLTLAGNFIQIPSIIVVPFIFVRLASLVKEKNQFIQKLSLQSTRLLVKNPPTTSASM
jgi:uncharacterized protein YqgC (DUF456 family)